MMAAITIAVASAAKVLIKIRIAGQSRHRTIHMIRNTIPTIPVVMASVKSTGSEKPAQPQAMKLMDEIAIRPRAMMSKIMHRQLGGGGGGGVVGGRIVVVVVGRSVVVGPGGCVVVVEVVVVVG